MLGPISPQVFHLSIEESIGNVNSPRDGFTVTLHGGGFVIYEGILSGTKQEVGTEPRGG
jgi:hypothetical protein